VLSKASCTGDVVERHFDTCQDKTTLLEQTAIDPATNKGLRRRCLLLPNAQIKETKVDCVALCQGQGHVTGTCLEPLTNCLGTTKAAGECQCSDKSYIEDEGYSPGVPGCVAVYGQAACGGPFTVDYDTCAGSLQELSTAKPDLTPCGPTPAASR